MNIWEIGNTRNNLVGLASSYTPVGSLNEFLKNQYEAKADHITVEMSFKDKCIYVYGNGKFMSVGDMFYVIKNINESVKGASHKGIGMMSFPRIAQKFTIVSKNGDAHTITDCVPDDKNMASDVGPEDMTKDRMSEYSDMIARIRRFPTGTIIRLDGVGCYRDDKHDLRFSMEDEFQKEFEKKLKDRNLILFNLVTCMLKSGNDKPVRLKPKPGRGHQLHIRIDRKHLPKDGNLGKRLFFSYNNFEYCLSLEANICVGPQNGEYTLMLATGGFDLLDIHSALAKDSNKFHKGLVCLNDKYAPFLGGYININIEPMNGGPEMDIYNQDRTNITQSILTGAFGDSLVNVLMYIEREYLRDALLKVMEDKSSAKEDKRDKELQDGMYSLMKMCADLTEGLSIAKNVNDVNPPGYIRCPHCIVEGVPIKTTSSEFKPKTALPGKIYVLQDQNDRRFCGSCKYEWDKKEMKERDPDADALEREPPVYDPDSDKPGVPRQKKHGFSYTFKVVKLNDNRPYRIFPERTRIEINGLNSEYVKIVNSKGMFSKAAKLHVRLMAIRALFEELRRTNQNRPTGDLQDRESMFMSRAITQIEIRDPYMDVIEEEEKKEEATPKVNGSTSVSAANMVAKLKSAWGAKETKKG